MNLQFLHLIEKLKTTKRTGWIYSKVDKPESIADHMYRMSLMALLIPDDSLVDKSRLVQMCLVHDVAECIVGDITPHDNISDQDKHLKEERAMNTLIEILGNTLEAQHMFELWKEYEQAQTKEAILAKDLDKFEMIVQAFEYEQRNATKESLESFFDSTKGKFKTAIVQQWVKELYEKRSI
jgi:putative hydrolase of HD superfamily